MVLDSVGIIGLGLAGKALARRLLERGYAVTGHDVSPEAVTAAAEFGVTPAHDAEAIARAHPTIILSLPDSDVVNRLLWSDGLAAGFPAAALVLDTTTGRPQDAADNQERLAAQSVRFVDVTLSGSSEDIAAGRATALVGDVATPDYDALVRAIAPTVFYLGGPGRGCLGKLVINHIMGLNRAALAEGLAMGMAAGMEGETLLEVIRESAAYSRVVDMKGERMVREDFVPASRIAQHAKDVRLILQEGERLGLAMRLERAHAELLEEAITAGLGDLDNAAIIKVCQGKTKG